MKPRPSSTARLTPTTFWVASTWPSLLLLAIELMKTKQNDKAENSE
jgi:hypothetical protein